MNDISAAINQLVVTAIHAGIGVVAVIIITYGMFGMFARRAR